MKDSKDDINHIFWAFNDTLILVDREESHDDKELNLQNTDIPEYLVYEYYSSVHLPNFKIKVEKKSSDFSTIQNIYINKHGDDDRYFLYEEKKDYPYDISNIRNDINSDILRSSQDLYFLHFGNELNSLLYLYKKLKREFYDFKFSLRYDLSLNSSIHCRESSMILELDLNKGKESQSLRLIKDRYNNGKIKVYMDFDHYSIVAYDHKSSSFVDKKEIERINTGESRKSIPLNELVNIIKDKFYPLVYYEKREDDVVYTLPKVEDNQIEDFNKLSLEFSKESFYTKNLNSESDIEELNYHSQSLKNKVKRLNKSFKSMKNIIENMESNSLKYLFEENLKLCKEILDRTESEHLRVYNIYTNKISNKANNLLKEALAS